MMRCSIIWAPLWICAHTDWMKGVNGQNLSLTSFLEMSGNAHDFSSAVSSRSIHTYIPYSAELRILWVSAPENRFTRRNHPPSSRNFRLFLAPWASLQLMQQKTWTHSFSFIYLFCSSKQTLAKKDDDFYVWFCRASCMLSLRMWRSDYISDSFLYTKKHSREERSMSVLSRMKIALGFLKGVHKHMRRKKVKIFCRNRKAESLKKYHFVSFLEKKENCYFLR